MKRIFQLTIGFLLFSLPLLSQEVSKETHLYAIKGQDSLFLDKYELKNEETNKPALIYVFGGGFVGGSRDSQVDYFRFLAKNGLTVFAIDYRLGLKNLKKAETLDPAKFAALLEHTISIAVEDLLSATGYIIHNAKEWNIDPAKVIVCGSSAGAITALQAEYQLCSNSLIAGLFPAQFNYAGVIAFAGAIFSRESQLECNRRPAPILLFHGDADSNVPYDKITIEGLGGMYGSKYIAEQLSAADCPYHFYSVKNAGHEIANAPMTDNRNEILSFINNLVFNKEQQIINTTVEQIGKSDMKKDITLEDMIKSNYGQ